MGVTVHVLDGVPVTDWGARTTGRSVHEGIGHYVGSATTNVVAVVTEGDPWTWIGTLPWDTPTSSLEHASVSAVDQSHSVTAATFTAEAGDVDSAILGTAPIIT